MISPLVPKDRGDREVETYRRIRESAIALRRLTRMEKQENEVLVRLIWLTRGEKMRLEERERARENNARSSTISQYTYTDSRKPYMDRCPVWGRGGGVLNSASVVRDFHSYDPVSGSVRTKYLCKQQTHTR